MRVLLAGFGPSPGAARSADRGKPPLTLPPKTPPVLDRDRLVAHRLMRLGRVFRRSVAVSSNVIRGADYGIAVSVPGAGAAVIADNLISDVRHGAIVGMEWKKVVTGDLAKDGASRYAQLSIGGNRVR